MYLLFFLLSHDSPKKGLICKETKRSLLLQYIHQLTRFRNLLSIVMHLRRTNQDRGVDHLEVDPLEVDRPAVNSLLEAEVVDHQVVPHPQR